MRHTREYLDRIPVNTLRTWNDVVMKGMPWEYAGWSGAPKEPLRHWTAAPPLQGEIMRIWELVEDVLSEDGFRLKPERIIANLFSHGDSSWLHKDSESNTGWTVIVYLNDSWDDNWHGGTAVIEETGLVTYVLPRPGKIAIFKSNLVHGPVPVSREALYPRLGLTFQCEANNISGLSETAISAVSASKL